MIVPHFAVQRILRAMHMGPSTGMDSGTETGDGPAQAPDPWNSQAGAPSGAGMKGSIHGSHAGGAGIGSHGTDTGHGSVIGVVPSGSEKLTGLFSAYPYEGAPSPCSD